MKIEQIWNEYRSSIKRFLHSKVSNASDVEDLLQEILLKTYSNLDNIHSTTSIKPWLFQIANNTIIDFYRRKAKTQEVRAEDLWFSEDNESLEKELSKCVAPFIRALPEEIAELLTAVDIHGESQKAYAEKNDISYSTLKSRVQKSRTELRNLLEDCCHLSLDRHGNVIDCDAKSSSCNKC